MRKMFAVAVLVAVSSVSTSYADEIDHLELLQLRAKVEKLDRLEDVAEITVVSAYLESGMLTSDVLGNPVPSNKFCHALGQLQMSLAIADVGHGDLSRAFSTIHIEEAQLRDLVKKYEPQCSRR